MQQYTRQQLIGHVRYTPNVLIGNWSEETELKRTVLKDFLQRKEQGTLQIDRFSERMGIALREVELTKAANDHFVHFGDLLQLVHCDSGAALAVDVEERDLRPGEKAVTATATSAIANPVARNTFVIAKYTPPVPSAYEVQSDDNILRYGQKIRLIVNSQAQAEELDAAGGPRPLHLFSKPISTTHYAKYGRNQLVGFTWRVNTYDSVWQVVTPEPAQRVASEGVEVLAGAPIVLVHPATQQALNLDVASRNRVPNDFGFEYEVSAKAVVSTSLNQTCESAVRGLMTKTLPKAETSPNHWCFLNGPKVATLPAPRAARPDASAVLAALSKQLARLTGGLQALERKVVPLQNEEGYMLVDEFLMTLKQLTVVATAAQLEALIEAFPAARGKHVNTRAMLLALRGAE